MLSPQNFDGEEFLECIKDLIRIDKEWVPRLEDCSLYIRPTFIGTEVHVHVLACIHVHTACCDLYNCIHVPAKCFIVHVPITFEICTCTWTLKLYLIALVQPAIGVHASSTALLYCIIGPAGPYFSTGTFAPVSLYADPGFVRAWPGGCGESKMGG